ncbi:MAG: four helix bundle protein [Bacteroidales bacterium]|jgi:four helix bundle protein|nr:four helix bundle protein [Bacteroidales bacterium]
MPYLYENPNNIIWNKSKEFAVRIVKLSQFLQNDKHEFVLSHQILKSGTSIGANIRESKNAQSISDFIHKLEIALKESDETEYWLDLLFETDYIPTEQYQLLLSQNKELTALLVSIIKKLKNKRDIIDNKNK